MINITDKRKCVGCGNCAKKCPHQCIKMEIDKEGFVYPKIDALSCSGCGICNKSCPEENIVLDDHEPFERIAIGAYHRNTPLRMRSSSGGVFPELAKKVIEQGGVVYGAAYTNSFSVEHIRIVALEDIEKLQGSKYVQSELNNTFPNIQDDLRYGKSVLFSGTPCQVKALHLYLGTTYTNLFTVEVVCHGVPSPLVFANYMRDIDAKSINFRNKEDNWTNYDVEITNHQGERIIEKASLNPYMRGFLQNITDRPSCSDCPAKNFTSGSDMTIGDFWGVKKIAPELFDDKGTSVLFLNTRKGEKLWDAIKNEFAHTQVDDIRKIRETNPCIYESCQLAINRGDFFNTINSISTLEALSKYTQLHTTLKDTIRQKIQFVWNYLYDICIFLRKKTSSGK